MNDLVSVIIPIYNASKYIENTMECLLAQSYNNLEIIAVNDTSTDNSLELINKYAKPFRSKGMIFKVINREQNGGLCAALNDGIKASSGDYMCFPDADDELNPDYVYAMMDTLYRHPDMQWVRCNYTIVREEEQREYDVILPPKSVYVNDYFDFVSKFIPHNAWNMIVSKKYFNECIGDQIHDSRLTQEWSLLLPLSYHSDYARCDKFLYRYHIRRNAMSFWLNKDLTSVIDHINKLECLNRTIINSISKIKKEDLDLSQHALAIYYCFMRHKYFIIHGAHEDAAKEFNLLKQKCDNIIPIEGIKDRNNLEIYVRLVFDILISADTSDARKKYCEYKSLFENGYEIYTDAPGLKLMQYMIKAYGKPINVIEYDKATLAISSAYPKACLIENSHKYNLLKKRDSTNGIYIDYRDLLDSIRGWASEERVI